MQKRYIYIDYLKAIAIFMVLTLHTGLWHENFIVLKSNISFVEYIFRLISEGVPIFILVNGFLLLPKELDLKKHIKKILKLLLLIVIWTTINILVINLIIHKEQLSFSLCIDSILKVDINSYYGGPLWFLQNLIMLYLIYPLLKLAYDSIYYNYILIIVLLFTFTSPAITTINNLFNFSFLTNISIFIKNINPITNGVFLSYFLIGGFLYKNKEKLFTNKKRILFIVLGIISWIVSIIYTYYVFKYKNISYSPNYIFGRITLVLIIIGLFSLFYTEKNSSNWFDKTIQLISKDTFGIFFIHWSLTKILSYYHLIPNTTFAYRLLYTLTVFVISLMLTEIIKRIPKVKNIVSL